MDSALDRKAFILDDVLAISAVPPPPFARSRGFVEAGGTAACPLQSLRKFSYRSKNLAGNTLADAEVLERPDRSIGGRSPLVCACTSSEHLGQLGSGFKGELAPTVSKLLTTYNPMRST